MELYRRNYEKLVEDALNRNKWAIGRLVSYVEDKRKESIVQREKIISLLSQAKLKRKAKCIGFTGAPGVGKSSLIASVVQELIKKDDKIEVAVLAVDPASSISGGAFLGDRQRLSSNLSTSEGSERIFFRSQSSNLELGGLSYNSFLVIRLFYYLFDYVCIETVGVGQNEIEVQVLADYTMMLLQADSGDQIQFLKAGIMEIPDIFILHKCDQNKLSVQKTYHALKESLGLSRLDKGAGEVPVMLCSSHTKESIPELSQVLVDFSHKQNSMRDKERYYFKKWILNEFGNKGLAQLSKGNFAKLTSATSATLDEILDKILDEQKSFDLAQLYYLDNL